MAKKIALIAVLAVLALAVGATGALADDIIASATGLASPTQTLTFEEIVLPVNTSLTNQYAGLGVSFSPSVFYSPQTNFGNVQGNDIGNFTLDGGGPISPVTFGFASALTGAAFSFEADGTPYLFEALLGGSVVDSFSATVGFGAASDFYGFNNITFDSIRITQTGTGGGPFWVADNLQFGSPATATPEPGSLALMGFGILGLAAAKLLKK
jgi:PEP-CTERM motif